MNNKEKWGRIITVLFNIIGLVSMILSSVFSDNSTLVAIFVIVALYCLGGALICKLAFSHNGGEKKDMSVKAYVIYGIVYLIISAAAFFIKAPYVYVIAILFAVCGIACLIKALLKKKTDNNNNV